MHIGSRFDLVRAHSEFSSFTLVGTLVNFGRRCVTADCEGRLATLFLDH